MASADQLPARPAPPAYDLLDATRIIATATTLEARVRERFPSSNLAGVCASMVATAKEAAANAESLAVPMKRLRLGSAVTVALLISLFLGVLTILRPKELLYSSVADFFQGVDAALNEVVLLFAAVYFLATLETRLKRRRALASLHRLRSLAHIIDMHQLTKDPDRITEGRDDTPASPPLTLDAFQLTRYLDYCAEMLALLSKLAALHVQRFDDPVTLSAVNDIEALTASLSGKIWQKIMILDRVTMKCPS